MLCLHSFKTLKTSRNSSLVRSHMLLQLLGKIGVFIDAPFFSKNAIWFKLLLSHMFILYLDVFSDAHMVMEDIKRTISELEQDSSLPAVGVELVDNELAVLYMNSKKSEVSAVR